MTADTPNWDAAIADARRWLGEEFNPPTDAALNLARCMLAAHEERERRRDVAQLFPIMEGKRGEGGRRSIPWALIAPQEAQARSNHGGSLQHIAERGGLDIAEAYAVLKGLQWCDVRDLDRAIVRAEVDHMVVEFEQHIANSDETTVRSDERARAERDIAAHVHAKADEHGSDHAREVLNTVADAILAGKFREAGVLLKSGAADGPSCICCGRPVQVGKRETTGWKHFDCNRVDAPRNVHLAGSNESGTPDKRIEGGDSDIMTTESIPIIKLSDAQKQRLADTRRTYAGAYAAFMEAVGDAGDDLRSIANELCVQFESQSRTWRCSPAGASTMRWIEIFVSVGEGLGDEWDGESIIHTWFQDEWPAAPNEKPDVMTAADLQPGDQFHLLNLSGEPASDTYVRVDGPLDVGAVNLVSGKMYPLMPDMAVTLVVEKEERCCEDDE